MGPLFSFVCAAARCSGQQADSLLWTGTQHGHGARRCSARLEPQPLVLCRWELLSIRCSVFAGIYNVLLNCIFRGEIDFVWKCFYVCFAFLKMTELCSLGQ